MHKEVKKAMPKTVTLRLEEATYSRFSRCAIADRRSIANLIETAALRYLDETIGVDDAEMDEIRRDNDLTRKLKRGAREVRRRQGGFVG